MNGPRWYDDNHEPVAERPASADVGQWVSYYVLAGYNLLHLLHHAEAKLCIKSAHVGGAVQNDVFKNFGSRP